MIKSWTTKKKILAIGVPILVLIFFFFGRGDEYTETEAVLKTSFTDSFLVFGNIEASSDVILAFEKGGTIDTIYKKEGDAVKEDETLASLDAEEFILNRNAAEQELLREQFILNDLSGGPNKEERDVSLANLEIAKHGTTSAYSDAALFIYESTSSIEKEIREIADVFFSNTKTDPTLNLQLNETESQRLESGRRILENIFKIWEGRTVNLTNRERIKSIIKETQTHLSTTDTFLNLLAKEFDNTNVSIAAEIREVRNIVINYIASISNKSNNLIAKEKEENYIQQQHNQLLRGATYEEVSIQDANVANKRELLNSTILVLEQSEIRAPFDGIVGEVYKEANETVTEGENVVRFISNRDLKIRIQVSELDIQYISLGEVVSFEIDAFEGIFSGRVTRITPTETYIGNAPVYMVELEILDTDERFKSGMSVSVSFIKDTLTNLIVIPTKAVMQIDGGEYVLLQNEELQEVQTGIRLGDGNIEIVEGLDVGDIVLIEANEG